MSQKSEQENAAYIRALLRERAMYVARGLDARVASVDAELARLGHEAAPPFVRAIKRPAPQAASR
jgi:hypothetical protein